MCKGVAMEMSGFGGGGGGDERGGKGAGCVARCVLAAYAEGECYIVFF